MTRKFADAHLATNPPRYGIMDYSGPVIEALSGLKYSNCSEPANEQNDIETYMAMEDELAKDYLSFIADVERQLAAKMAR